MPATSGNRWLVGPRRPKRSYTTEERKARGYGYDSCPLCGGVKAKVSKNCRTCANAIGRSGTKSPARDSLRMPNRNMVTGGQ